MTLLQDRYEILGQLGRGGMGSVFRGRDRHLDGKLVALKCFTPPPDCPEAATLMKLFDRESRILSQLSHPAIVRVTDTFQVNGEAWIVMDLVEGQSLTQRLQNGPLPVDEVLQLARQLCDALEYLHAQTPPIVWRDAKPDNVMLDATGRVRLIDFGIARIFAETSSTTTAGMAFGSPGYASPEQYGIQNVDPRADIYGLGAVLYSLLTAKVPPPSIDILYSGVSLEPPHQINPAVPLPVSQAILQMMAPQVEQRLANIAAVRSALERGRAERMEMPRQPPPRSRIGAVLACVGVAIAAAVLLMMPRSLQPQVGPIPAGAVWIRGVEHDLVVATSRDITRQNAWRVTPFPDDSIATFACGAGSVACATKDGHVKVFSDRDGSQRLDVATGMWKNQLALCKDGVAVASLNGGVSFIGWNSRHIDLPDTVDRLTLAPDGTLIAWSQGSSVELRTISGDATVPMPEVGDVLALTFTPDGQHLAMGTSNGNVTICDHNGQRTGSATCPGQVRCVVFSPSGRTLLTAGGDHLVRLWDEQTGKLLRDDLDAGDQVYSLDADGDSVTAVTPRTIVRWKLPHPLP